MSRPSAPSRPALRSQQPVLPGPDISGPAGHRQVRAITTGLVGTVLASVAGIVLIILGWSHLAISDAISQLGSAASAIAYAALGALIVRRTGNLIGWFMLAEGAALAVMTAGSGYAIVGLKGHLGVWPAAAAVGALSESVFVVVNAGLAAIFLVFPTGRQRGDGSRPVGKTRNRAARPLVTITNVDSASAPTAAAAGHAPGWTFRPAIA